jgi:hypothetical protein
LMAMMAVHAIVHFLQDRWSLIQQALVSS